MSRYNTGGKNEGREISVTDEDLGKCRYCHRLVAWLVSQKTGKKYPVNVSIDAYDDIVNVYTVRHNNFHGCKEREETLPRQLKTIAL